MSMWSRLIGQVCKRDEGEERGRRRRRRRRRGEKERKERREEEKGTREQSTVLMEGEVKVFRTVC